MRIINAGTAVGQWPTTECFYEIANGQPIPLDAWIGESTNC